MQDGGTLLAIKLVHKSGYVGFNYITSQWGGGSAPISIAITDIENRIIFPNNLNKSGWFTHPSYNSKSNEIIMNNASRLIEIKEGMILRLWYGEDLKEITELDNSGRTCTDVYAKVTGII